MIFFPVKTSINTVDGIVEKLLLFKKELLFSTYWLPFYKLYGARYTLLILDKDLKKKAVEKYPVQEWVEHDSLSKK